MITEKLRPFGTTIFAEMTALAEKHGAINLAQGFPDFEGPSEIVEAAVRALSAQGKTSTPDPGGTLSSYGPSPTHRRTFTGWSTIPWMRS